MMKIFFLLVIVFVFAGTRAQESKVRVGIEITPTLSWLSGDGIDDYTSRISVAPGFSFDYLLNEQLAIKTGLIYEPLGVSYTVYLLDNNGAYTGQTRELKNNYDYLTLPVLFSYSTKGKVRFYVNGGVFFGILLSHKYIFSPVGNLSEEVEDLTDKTKSLNFGLSHGIGLNILLGENFIIDLGSWKSREYHCDDLRSTLNFNTGLPGTLQKYTSQSAVFRLVLNHFPDKKPDLYKNYIDKKYIEFTEKDGKDFCLVPLHPKDMRKSFLSHAIFLGC